MFFGCGIPAVNWCLCSASPTVLQSRFLPCTRCCRSRVAGCLAPAGKTARIWSAPKGASELAIHRIWDWLRKKSWWPWSKAIYKRLGYVRYLQFRFLKWPLIWLRKWMEDDFRWNLDECFSDLWSKGTRQFSESACWTMNQNGQWIWRTPVEDASSRWWLLRLPCEFLGIYVGFGQQERCFFLVPEFLVRTADDRTTKDVFFLLHDLHVKCMSFCLLLWILWIALRQCQHQA